jgi:hypothetical protein
MDYQGDGIDKVKMIGDNGDLYEGKIVDVNNVYTFTGKNLTTGKPVNLDLG